MKRLLLVIALVAVSAMAARTNDPVVPDSVTKVFMMGNEVSIVVLGDSVMLVWSPSNRTVHVGAE